MIESERKAAARLSVELGIPVTRAAVRYWRSKGYPLDDVDALRHRLRLQERSPVHAATAQSPGPAQPITHHRLTITVADAAERERQLLAALVGWMVGMDAGEEITVGLAACALDAYAGAYGKHLGDVDEFAAELRQALDG